MKAPVKRTWHASRLTAVLAIVGLVLGLSTVAVAAPGRGSGGGGGNGGGGNGGGGGGGGQGEEFADLVIAYRDADGLPTLVGPFVDEHGDESYCVQPITENTQVPNPRYGQEGEAQFLSTVTNPVDGRTVTLVPLFAHFPEYLPVQDEVTIAAPPEGKGPPEDHDEEEGGEPCDPLVIPVGDLAYPDGMNYGQYVTEVELERLNMARAPENVLEQHMIELEALLAGTDPSLVTLDPAGRITFDGVAIDAMPKLQGMRETLLETGTLPGAGAYPFPFQLTHEDFDDWSPFQLSAFALGGAASKFGAINVDTIAYHDRVMGIAEDWLANNPTGWTPKVLTHPQTGEMFVDYRGFTYDRAATFPGYVTYLDPANWTAGYQVARWADVVDFPALLPKLDNVAGYAQMAKDAIALILFIHEYDATIAYADPVGIADQAEAQRIADELNGATTIAPPAAPTEVTAVEDGGDVTVSWTASIDGGPVSTYDITLSPGGTTYTVDGDATSYTVTKLPKGRTCTFTVQATGPGGSSEGSHSNAVRPLPGSGGR